MPQMYPMNWMMIMTYFLTIFYFMIMLIYYFNINLNNNNNNHKLKKNQMNIKW
uniref:ATP synthase complex subunit 8 n=1 Tax=Paduniella communis TaxID=2904892 RepID=A0A9E8RT42_9NEOP|nr:ATP synthase F0 subunit 8 [Paduniella communis]UZZ44250.1 ATP synthase F0 subunit 8 [Paduniella communis]